MSCTQFLGQSKEVLSAVQVTASHKSSARIVPGELVEIGDVVTMRSNCGDGLPYQQTCKYQSSPNTPACLGAAKIGGTAAGYNREQGKYQQQMPKTGIVFH